VRKGTVLVSVVAQLPEEMIGTVGDYKYTDKSLIYQDDEEAVVESVTDGTDSGGKKFYKVKLRCYRPLCQGDKIASRAGNKSIVAKIMDQSELPYTEE
jgi:DNA-directed RNA polymerase beta subunit